MNEQPSALSPEQIEQAEQMARYEAWRKDNPVQEVVPKTEQECKEAMAEFDELIEAFKSEHSLEALMAIVDLKPDQAIEDPLRQPAKLALNPIYSKLATLKKEPNITPEENAALTAKYMELSRAIGMFIGSKLSHNW